MNMKPLAGLLCLAVVAAIAMSADDKPAAEKPADKYPHSSKLKRDLLIGSTTDKADAADELAKLGQDLRTLVGHLEYGLRDKDALVRLRCANALGEIGPSACAAVPGLRGALQDQNSGVRAKAADALQQIGPMAWDALPELISALNEDPDDYVRQRAAAAIGSLGPLAKEALPALTKAAESRDKDLALAAQTAIKLCTAQGSNRTRKQFTPEDGPRLIIPRREEQRTDKELIQGTWVHTSIEYDGTEMKAGPEFAAVKDAKLSFKGDTVSLSASSGVGSKTPQRKGTFALDPDREPPTLDIAVADPEKGPGAVTVLLLYEVNGDTLRLCGSRTEGTRPKEFTSKDNRFILTLKREPKRPEK
jgi:uncharacterized protein (TIGR03067 family)